jgi:pimeloyl-ACP methyl ester carboxylesterase
MFFIPIFAAIGLGLFFLIADAKCKHDVKESYRRLEKYKHKEIQLESNVITYVDRGKGDVVLSIHGICGGYDQGVDTAGHLLPKYRVIAPSRFGYLGSSIPADPSPKEQAKVFAELLDSLEIDKVYLLGASTGGTIAIRFALDYPERTKGLILYSSTPPSIRKPKLLPNYAGQPKAICSNFGMYMASLFFKPSMSIARDAVYSMLPVSDRRDGIINDGSVTNLDMALNFDEYRIEDLKIPTLIFHAKNDKLSKYKLMEQGARRFPNNTFITFETGGHMLEECGRMIVEAETAFFGQASEEE